MRESVLPLDSIAEIGATSLLVGRYSATAVYVVQVYEWLLTLGEEYDLIHKARWTSVKVAYLICRYFPLLVFPVYLWAWLGDHSPTLCARIIHPLYGCITIFQLSAQAVILIRTFAFTGRNIIVLLVLSTCFIILATAEIWLFGTRFTSPKELYWLLGDSACFGNDGRAQAGGSFAYLHATQSGLVVLSAFLMDLLMMVIVIVHCFRIRSTRGPLGRTFVLQGFGTFVVISALNLLTAIMYLGPDRQYDGMGLPFLLVLPDVLSCRLILLLRRRVSPTETLVLKHHSRLVREALESGGPEDETVDHWL